MAPRRTSPAKLVIVAIALSITALHASAARAEGSRRNLRTEWIIDGALGVAWLALIPAALRDPTPEARFGPVFHGPEDVDVLSEAAAAGTIGRTHLDEETVTDSELLISSFSFLGGSLVLARAAAVGRIGSSAASSISPVATTCGRSRRVRRPPHQRLSRSRNHTPGVRGIVTTGERLRHPDARERHSRRLG